MVDKENVPHILRDSYPDLLFYSNTPIHHMENISVNSGLIASLVLNPTSETK